MATEETLMQLDLARMDPTGQAQLLTLELEEEEGAEEVQAAPEAEPAEPAAAEAVAL